MIGKFLQVADMIGILTAFIGAALALMASSFIESKKRKWDRVWREYSTIITSLSIINTESSAIEIKCRSDLKSRSPNFKVLDDSLYGAHKDRIIIELAKVKALQYSCISINKLAKERLAYFISQTDQRNMEMIQPEEKDEVQFYCFWLRPRSMDFIQGLSDNMNSDLDCINRLIPNSICTRAKHYSRHIWRRMPWSQRK